SAQAAQDLKIAETAANPSGASASVSQDSAQNNSKNAEGSTIKVDIEKLDDLMDLVGELVISQSLISQNPSVSSIESQVLKDNLSRLFRITKQLQQTTMAMRMVPIRATFQKMNRVVRNLSTKLGKKIQLQISGEETELDRTVVEEVSD